MSVIIQDIEVLDSKYTWLGYAFKMSDNSKNVTCKISNMQNCCEKFGIHTKCNLDEFIGAEYQSVNIVKKHENEHYCDTMVIVEVTVQTNRGKIIVQLYNEHNGYYPHDFYVQSEHGQNTERM